MTGARSDQNPGSRGGTLVDPRIQVEPALPIQLHPLPSPAHSRSSLPAQLTSFFGREKELGAASALLRQPEVRLVTLTGPGGIGKSSLSLCIAERLAPEFADGVWFVPLAPIAAGSEVAGAIAASLGIRDSTQRGIEEALETYLHGRETLLVLDNFEHVLGAAPLVTRLLRAAPGVKCLVSSRAVLRLSAEHELPVPPPPFPGLEGHDDRIRAEASPAVRLLLARA
jgi:predicted ATPase